MAAKESGGGGRRELYLLFRWRAIVADCISFDGAVSGVQTIRCSAAIALISNMQTIVYISDPANSWGLKRCLKISIHERVPFGVSGEFCFKRVLMQPGHDFFPWFCDGWT